MDCPSAGQSSCESPLKIVLRRPRWTSKKSKDSTAVNMRGPKGAFGFVCTKTPRRRRNMPTGSPLGAIDNPPRFSPHIPVKFVRLHCPEHFEFIHWQVSCTSPTLTTAMKHSESVGRIIARC